MKGDNSSENELQTPEPTSTQDSGNKHDEEYKVGPGKPPLTARFTSEKQPSNEAKSKGVQKMLFNRSVIREMMQRPLEMDWTKGIGKELFDLYGEDIKTVAAGVLMTRAQMSKALKAGDTYAFNSVTDHGFGRPVQAIAPSNTDGEPLPQITLAIPIGMNINLPSNTEGIDKSE